MRANTLFLLCGLALITHSCARREAVVERESKVRTRMEAFGEQYDANGKFQYDRSTAEQAFVRTCAKCHKDPEVLTKVVLTNPQRFWNTINFGNDSLGMPAFVDDTPFHDLVDVTGYCMFRPLKPEQ